MKTSWQGSTFRISGLLWGETPITCGFLTKGLVRDRALVSVDICCWPKCAVEITVELPVIWNSLMFMQRHCHTLTLLFSAIRLGVALLGTTAMPCWMKNFNAIWKVPSIDRTILQISECTCPYLTLHNSERKYAHSWTNHNHGVWCYVFVVC